jgi:hypothetical protein
LTSYDAVNIHLLFPPFLVPTKNKGNRA